MMKSELEQVLEAFKQVGEDLGARIEAVRTEAQDNTKAVVKAKRPERLLPGLITSIPKLPPDPRLITIVKEFKPTFRICVPLKFPMNVPLPLNTSTVSPLWKLLPFTVIC